MNVHDQRDSSSSECGEPHGRLERASLPPSSRASIIAVGCDRSSSNTPSACPPDGMRRHGVGHVAVEAREEAEPVLGREVPDARRCPNRAPRSLRALPPNRPLALVDGDREAALGQLVRGRQARDAAPEDSRLCQRPKTAPRPRPGSPAVFDEPTAVRGNISAARAVEVAGEDVERVDEPARRRPEALRRGADPPVDRGPRRARQLARHAPDLRRRDAARRGHVLGRDLAGQRTDRAAPGHVAPPAPADWPATRRTACAPARGAAARRCRGG